MITVCAEQHLFTVNGAALLRTYYTHVNKVHILNLHRIYVFKGIVALVNSQKHYTQIESRNRCSPSLVCFMSHVSSVK